MKKYVFDLDNTLIYTDDLNNNSYNYALKCSGLKTIDGVKRITKDVVFEKYPDIDNIQKKEIVNLKHNYFINNMHCTKLNEELVNFLRSQNKNDCILWTSANEKRVKFLLNYYSMNDLFKYIFVSKKIDISNDIEIICNLHNCGRNQLEIYEDNLGVIKELEKLNINKLFVCGDFVMA